MVYYKTMIDFDNHFKDFYPWLKGQWDPTSGGFYYARSSIFNGSFKPDIESTAQAISILERSNLIDSMPDSMRVKLINFFKERQNSNGYFIDPHNSMKDVDRMVARALSYSVNSLKILGEVPTYPVPGNSGLETLPPYFKSIELFKEWLDSRPWDYAWMAGDNISAASIYIKGMSKELSDSYLSFLLKYLDDRQDSNTGMWGDGRPYIKISGAFKLALFYNRFALPIPNADKIYNYLLYTIRNDISEDICWSRNVMDLLLFMKNQLPKIAPNDRDEILSITWSNIGKYKKPDGGFSRHIDRSLEVPNNVPLGLGLIEGDMNASTQALKVRSLSLQFLGLVDRPIKEFTKIFY